MSLPALIPALVLVGTPTITTPRAEPILVAVAGQNPAKMPQGTNPAPIKDSAAPAPETAPGPANEVANPVAADRAVQPAATHRHAKGDPLEGFNRNMFGIHQSIDRAVFRPAAMGYKKVVPEPARDGLRNVISNLGEPIVFLNYLLQLKPGKAIETLARFSINSTLGIGGLFDMAAKPGVRLPHRPNGLGNTLGYYGVKPGPYIFLPLVGPSTLRDFFGGQADGLILPLAVGDPFDRMEYQIPKGVIGGLDLRAESEDELHALFDGAVDPYATLRSAYLQSRQGEIDALHGHRQTSGTASELQDDLACASPAGQPNTPELADPMNDPAAAPAATSPAPPADKSSTAPGELSDPLADPAAARAVA